MNNWISVKERLPEKNGNYLVVVAGYANSKPYVKIEWFMKNLKLHPDFRYDSTVTNGQSGWWNGDSEGSWIDNDVIYWMPLPEIPDEKEWETMQRYRVIGI